MTRERYPTTESFQYLPLLPASVREDEPSGEPEHTQAFNWPEVLRILVVALAAVAVGLRLWEPFSAFSVIGVLGLLVGGWPIFQEVVESILARRMTMELSMTIAIVAAAASRKVYRPVSAAQWSEV